jgi:hypothetical protein
MARGLAWSLTLPLRFGTAVFALALVTLAPPASAQWTQDEGVAALNVFSLSVKGDTILAGVDTCVFVSTNAGATWHASSRVAPSVTAVGSVLMRNGRLYAGTFGQGVFISDDLGLTWQAFNQGLVGGFANSQLDLSDLVVRGDSIFASTFGAGVYVRRVTAPSTWSHFGEEFEPNQASNVNVLALGGTRLLAGAGANGSVFFRDPGAPEWTVSWLNNVGLSPGRQAVSAFWNGHGWVVGTQNAIFSSTLGQEPWVFTQPGLGLLTNTAFAARGGQLFGAFDIVNGCVIEHSVDDGVTWEFLEFLPGAFVYKLAVIGSTLYAARSDGLWVRSIATLSVPPPVAAAGLRFRIAGPQPVGAEARLAFELPEAGSTTLEVFDVTGRRAAETQRQSWGAGAHEFAVDARGLAPGIYAARLTAAGQQAVVRFAHVR